MSGRCTFASPKANINAAHECNIQPYSTFMSVVMYLLPTFIVTEIALQDKLILCSRLGMGIKSSYLSNTMQDLDELWVDFRWAATY